MRWHFEEAAIESHNGGAASPKPTDQLLRGRYRRGALLGKGGFGEVFVAKDTFRKQTVALKRIPRTPDRLHARTLREVRALQILQIPGVVKLLDSWENEQELWIVMEKIDGAPFPGQPAPVSWAALMAPAIALLETLARIHQTGIVHRDLKPENVLVSVDGRPTVLDFGIARGNPLGSTITAANQFVGTPLYTAPELFFGKRPDVQADLYAVGVMLYEALTGEFPPRPPEPIPNVEMVPGPIWSVIRALLAPQPTMRPGSAAAVLVALQKSGAQDHTSSLPWLGARAPINALVEAATQRRPARVVGPAGSGRSRCLAEAARILEAAGHRVVHLPNGRQPFSSLAPVLGAQDPTWGLAELAQAAEQAVLKALAAGAVVIASAPGRTDRWSRQLLTRCRHVGALLDAGPDDPNEPIRLTPLPQEALRNLFNGPDRLLHLPEDAARELWRRTDGLPARIVIELRAWVNAGLAQWDSERLTVNRAGLAQLQARANLAPAGQVHQQPLGLDAEQEELIAWLHLAAPHGSIALLRAATQKPRWLLEGELAALNERGAAHCDERDCWIPDAPPQALQRWGLQKQQEACRQIANALEEGTPGRLSLLLLATDSPAAAREALTLSETWIRQGRFPEAIAALSAASTLYLDGDDSSVPVDLLRTWTCAALAAGTRAALLQARDTLSRAQTTEPFCLALLEAALGALSGQSGQALKILRRLPPAPSQELEEWRWICALNTTQHLSAPEFARVVEAARRQASSALAARLAGWEGLLAYRRGDFSAAAEAHQRAVAGRRTRTGRLSSLNNAAAAQLECGNWEQATKLAQTLLDEAVQCRHSGYEARALWCLRTVGYRAGTLTTPDLELIDALEVMGGVDIQGAILLNEAAIAWRSHEHRPAAALSRAAQRAFQRLKQPIPELLAWALLERIEPGALDRPAALIEEALACPLPGVTAQVLGLLAEAGHPIPPDGVRKIVQLAASTPREHHTRRREVLSMEECVSSIRSDEP